MEITQEYLDKKFDEVNKGVDRKFNTLLLEIGQNMGRMGSSLDAKIESIKSQMATKEDLKNFATKEDLKGFATKEDLKMGLEAATKDVHKFVIDGFTAHEIWVQEEFKDWIKPYDSRITKVETDVAQLKLNKKALA